MYFFFFEMIDLAVKLIVGNFNQKVKYCSCVLNHQSLWNPPVF